MIDKYMRIPGTSGGHQNLRNDIIFLHDLCLLLIPLQPPSGLNLKPGYLTTTCLRDFPTFTEVKYPDAPHAIIPHTQGNVGQLEIMRRIEPWLASTLSFLVF